MERRRTARRPGAGRRAAWLGALLMLVPACATTPGDTPSGSGAGPQEVTRSRDPATHEIERGRDPAGRERCQETGTDGSLRCPASGPGSTPPPWLGTRVLPETEAGFGEVRPTPRALRTRRFTLPDTVPMLPGRGFAAKVVDPAPADVIARSTWAPGCPVDRDELAWVRLTFRGFDAARHTGELLVNSAVADDVVEVFRALYRASFPMEQVVIVRTYDPDEPPTGDGNGTGGFVCRPTTGATSYSQHAYGLAIDVNTFQNPYTKGDVVLPELASSYLDRGWVRPGMVVAGGPVVEAFAEIGWGWGGDWSSLKDYQHFSRNGL